jgi:hypothetical protein
MLSQVCAADDALLEMLRERDKMTLSSLLMQYAGQRLPDNEVRRAEPA